MKESSLRPMRIRYSNRFKCLLVYLIAFALPLVWQIFALGYLYPRKLAFAAPDVTGVLGIAGPEGMSLSEQLIFRENLWLKVLALCALCAWGMTLLLQLFWRMTHVSPIRLLKGTGRAVRHYRLTVLLICFLLLGITFALWHFGLQHVPGRTAWDWIITFGVYPLLPLSAVITSRLAAPAVLSGKGAFFKRI